MAQGGEIGRWVLINVTAKKGVRIVFFPIAIDCRL